MQKNIFKNVPNRERDKKHRKSKNRKRHDEMRTKQKEIETECKRHKEKGIKR